MENVIAWLQKYWQILAFSVTLVAGVAVAGEQIHNMGKKLTEQQQKIEELSDLKAKQERIDERTQLMYEEQKTLRIEQRTTNDLLHQLLLRVQ